MGFSSSESLNSTRCANSETVEGSAIWGRTNAKEEESSTRAGINREIGHPSDHRFMKIRLLIGAVATSLLIMAGLATGEKLAKADGTVSAKTLPLDKKLASKKYETATFGLG